MSDRRDHSQRNRSPRRRDDIVERKSRVLFIRNISFNVTEESVRKLFEKYGEIKRVFGQIENRGIAFVTFYDIRDAIKAHEELNKIELDGRPIKIHYSLPKDNEINQKDSLENHANLYVVLRNFQKVPSKDETFHYFEQFGEVSEIRESADKPNIKFVEYYDSRAAMKALEATNNAQWNEGTLEVKYASFSKKDLERIEETKVQLKELKREQDTKDRLKEYSKNKSSNSPTKSVPPSSYPLYPPQYANYPPSYPPYQSQYVGYQYPPYFSMQIPPQYAPPRKDQQPVFPNAPSQPPSYPYQNQNQPYYQQPKPNEYPQHVPQRQQPPYQYPPSSNEEKKPESNRPVVFSPYSQASSSLPTKPDPQWGDERNPNPYK